MRDTERWRLLGISTYRSLAEKNRDAIAAHNRQMLSILSLTGAVMMLLPLLAVPFSSTKGAAIPAYLLAIGFFLLLYIVGRSDRFARYVLTTLYAGFSVFFILAIYLSTMHSPHMRATVILGVFCIMPLSFIDYPIRIDGFLIFWFIVHAILAHYYKPGIALDDLVNTLGFGILGAFFGNINLTLRLKNFETQRLLTIEKETDPLTGLHNRRKLLDTLSTLGEPGVIKPTGILMIDIDFFKEFNDTHGHLPADECLEQLAGFFLSLQEKKPLSFYRYGGEEFVALAYGHTEEELLREAEYIRATVAQESVITVSIGAAYCGEDPQSDWKDMLERADQAVFAAKRAGRNRVYADSGH